MVALLVGSSGTSEPGAAASVPTRAAASAQQQAEQELDRYLQEDIPDVRSMMDGRHVAMLAARTDGIVDHLQNTRSGSHTFRWVDILAEHRTFRTDPRFGSSVRLLLSTEVGQGLVDSVSGRPYLTTIADERFSDRQDVLRWCAVTFSNLTALQRDNTCVPARLTPHGG